MQPRDRSANVLLLVATVVFWIVTVAFLALRSPREGFAVQLAGAGLIGLASAVTVTPLFWLATFARQRRIAYRGDWVKAARRGAWVGLVVAFFVALRTQGAFSVPIALFVLVMVILVEGTLSVRR